jgi:uncharacterized protein (TIGR03437 family)
LVQAQVNILTANGGNERSNSNLQETQLSPATVAPFSFGKLGSFPVDGQVFAQPLYVSNLAVSGKKTRNILFVSTMHNSVYAFDADALSPVSILWKANLGSSVPASLLFGQYGDINNEVGIVSTGAIDLQRGVIYVVTDVLEGGRPAFYLHALDLATGEERLHGPAALTATVPGTGAGSYGNGTLPFDPMQHVQRASLLLANNSVYVGFGSHADQPPFHGWLMTYDASDLTRQLGVYVTTPNGSGGALWQSGRGPAADQQGNIYAITGNGDNDGVQNFGESFIKLSPPDTTKTADWFAPPNWKSLSDNDFDISAGPALLAGTHTLVGADKVGTLYVVGGDAMHAPGTVSMIPASTGSIFNLAVWSFGGGANVYLQGERDPLKCFQILGGNVSTDPISIGANTVRFARIGMMVSANGGNQDSGILWETTGDYNSGTPGTLHAYDASNLANELWNSDMNSDRDQMPPVTKFVAPTVVNGKVYLAGLSNSVTVYGLLSQPSTDGAVPSISAVANAASYTQDAVSPGEVVAISGSNLGPITGVGLQLDSSGMVATTLGDTQVLFDGVPSPLIYSSAGQVNAVVPFGVAGGTTQVQVQYDGAISDSFLVAVAPATIGIFSADASGAGQAIMLNQDGSINSADKPAPPGSVVTLWATGAGQSSPVGIDGSVVTAQSLPLPVLPVTALIGGNAAQVLYAGGGPGMVEGVIQVNVLVPASTPGGNAVPVVLHVGDSVSQTNVTLAVASQ